MRVNDDGIRLLALGAIEKAVDDWKGLCNSMCTCGKVQYLYEDSAKKYFCTNCGKIAKENNCKFKRETTRKCSFKELEQFFTDGTVIHT